MNLVNKIKENVPELPGCYIYFDETKNVIYVGKAKKLKKRMLSYFNRANNTKTQHLVSKIKDFDYYVTNNESEALILENNLIKEHNPFYNIILKDDKRYPYILLTNQEHPRLIKTRTRNKKGKYYGPYPSSIFASLVLDFLNQNVPLVKCKNIPNKKCLYYDIGQCYGPCIKEVSKDQIKEYKKQIDKYLQSDMKKLTKKVEEKMLYLASKQQYEQAKKQKDFLDLLKDTDKTQSVELSQDINIDYVSYYKDDNFICICILQIKQGKLINIHRSLFPYYDDGFEEISGYLYTFYKKSTPEFFTTQKKEITPIMEGLLLMTNKNLDKKLQKNLEEISNYNMQEYYKKNINKITSDYFIKKTAGYDKLKELVKGSVKIIEMIDISHLGGDAQVGAVVVYKNGIKAKELYRKYKIKDKSNLQDDYGSIKEVLTRRYKRAIKENTLPNLLIVDGSKGQVSSALEVLRHLKIDTKIKLIGLSKDDKHKTKGIVNKNLEEKIIPKNGDLYKFLFDIQEEVHRFAIDYHRKLKGKSTFQSQLDNIPNIGPKRKTILIKHFEYVENIKNAKEEDFKGLGLPNNIVNNIIKYFKELQNK